MLVSVHDPDRNPILQRVRHLGAWEPNNGHLVMALEGIKSLRLLFLFVHFQVKLKGIMGKRLYL